MSLGWLFRQYDLVNRAMYMAVTERIRGVELGTSRALAGAFSKATIPALPTYDENMKQQMETRQDAERAQASSFVERVEQANKIEARGKNGTPESG